MYKVISLGAIVLVSGLVLSGCSSGTTGEVETSSSFVPKETTTQSSSASQSSTSRLYTGGDRDCGDFSTHSEAQAYFQAKGGSPSNNVDRLDRDRDGIACETLP